MRITTFQLAFNAAGLTRQKTIRLRLLMEQLEKDGTLGRIFLEALSPLMREWNCVPTVGWAADVSITEHGNLTHDKE